MASTVDTVLAVEKTAVNHVEDTLGHGAVNEARQASDDEHSQTLMQALRENRKAVMWSVLISVSIIMEGYDTILMANFSLTPRLTKSMDMITVVISDGRYLHLGRLV
jgi:SP family general alpha glucoside:H+ symporter-like MFS transporter